MKCWITLGVFIFLVPRFAQAEKQPVPYTDETFTNGEQKWAYRKYDLHGWSVYIEQSLAKKESLVKDLHAQLNRSFAHIVKEVPAEPVKFLKTIPVWVSDEPNYPLRKGEKGLLVCHLSKGWVKWKKLNPHMVPGVHIINPNAVLYEHKIFDWGPMTILHEMSHAYHAVRLRKQGMEPAIKDAYEKAMAAKLYHEVPDRKDPKKKTKAYAASNRGEYFAELTEAYFGTNDYFPKTREALKEYDPDGFGMIEKTWGVR